MIRVQCLITESVILVIRARIRETATEVENRMVMKSIPTEVLVYR